MSDSEWRALAKRAAILRSAGDDEMTRTSAELAASALNVHPATIYRWRKRLLDAGLITALQDRRRGFPKGHSRLSPAQEGRIGKSNAFLTDCD